MSKPVQWSEVMRQVIELFEKGKQVEEIAKILGLSIVFVRGVVKMRGMF